MSLYNSSHSIHNVLHIQTGDNMGWEQEHWVSGLVCRCDGVDWIWWGSREMRKKWEKKEKKRWGEKKKNKRKTRCSVNMTQLGDITGQQNEVYLVNAESKKTTPQYFYQKRWVLRGGWQACQVISEWAQVRCWQTHTHKKKTDKKRTNGCIMLIVTDNSGILLLKG